MLYQNIKIDTNKAEQILFEEFNIEGTARELPGEVDFNFKISTSSKKYILKISRPDERLDYLKYQQALLKYVEGSENNLPKVIADVKGNAISNVIDDEGNIRYVRLLSWVDGRLWSMVNPISNELRFSLGVHAGKLTKLLQGFDHKEAYREFHWDIAQGSWTFDHIHLFSDEKKTILRYFQERFKENYDEYSKLRKSVVHNDANDNNVVVSKNLIKPEVEAIIDFGDAVHTPIINDVAITCAYAIMGFNNPLEAALSIVKGYHKEFSLNEKELGFLFDAIAMRLVISVTKSAINKLKEPDNEYLLISEKPAWEVLKKWKKISTEYAHYAFRNACGFSGHPNETKVKDWLSEQQVDISTIFPTIESKGFFPLNLGIDSLWLGNYSKFNDLDVFDFKINQLQKEHPNKMIAGGYLEPRALYTSNDYETIGNYGRESRTIHLGIDFWVPVDTPVYLPFEGEVVTVADNNKYKEYGGLIIVKHQANGITFYTLYGHLSLKSLALVKVGSKLAKGSCIGFIGNREENGSWSPHLHFQIMLSMLNFVDDFPGVAIHSEIDVWKSMCPDPNLLFKSERLRQTYASNKEDIRTYRKNHLGKSLSLQYKKPLKIVRGQGVYLIDEFGNRYLDTVNNVAHVGHEHPKVVEAGQEQMAVLNTNSRYLHENINEFAKELIDTLPPQLNVIHFVNSGSEANELAIRMAKANTNQKDIIASEVGYHGNSNMCIDISSYKFDGKGGTGAPEFTHIIPLPDTFRGKYTSSNASEQYVNEVKKKLELIKDKGRNVGAFIIEPIISCGGQVELPDGFLTEVYELVRKEGGLCISDEVQTGCGRMGKTFWGFQLHNVIPDIVSIGKPLGNGHPLAAVACTQEVANNFANGMEYFNTFGGNPVSCAIGASVLKVVREEKLQENALKVGEYLKSGLNRLAKEFPIIGDVRGEGLFLGFELVTEDKDPLSEKASYLANRMKDFKILMSTDGLDNNVLKIKPPMVFSKTNADELLFFLEKIFKEDFMNS
ncbi:4-aminobutyrate aminotransferase [Tenacibaculum sp. MAR_2009_124]|uniref:aminotransferase class III-fold pyridoxal phosphate-dependent enzyme n=1 Tax=Tenacibaculum sp. MAR_2009_124 TaxID=1250059 RepID=UPI00089B2CFC|nr:aminotransferase class III-fold pyridoxal phosphate-dependent enzyme [Tenacibaculum sp. MAR_2009_124]SEC94554.1 4-aminobutyrate aminotransferase [Tenacibaculum sp. MAR_2009_124]